ncbi:MAG: hypothetical protein Q7U31_13250, partial [Anaerolineaceae bacterium]|nr:hypothetical protein [Anaerolineaceae bacterium]
MLSKAINGLTITISNHNTKKLPVAPGVLRVAILLIRIFRRWVRLRVWRFQQVWPQVFQFWWL